MKKILFIIGFVLLFVSCSVTKVKYITKEIIPEQNAERYKIYIQEDESIPSIKECKVIYSSNHIWSYQESFYPLGIVNTEKENVVRSEWKSGVKVTGIKMKNGVVTSMTIDGKTYKVK